VVVAAVVEFLVNESLDSLFQTLHDRFLQFGYDIQLKYDKISSKIFIAVPPDLK
jgi:hypothetical protein